MNKIPKWTKENTENLNTPITSKETELVILKLPTESAQVYRWLHWRKLPNFQGRINTSSSQKPSQKKKKEENTSQFIL